MVFTDCGRAYLTGYVASVVIVEEYLISVKGFHSPINRRRVQFKKGAGWNHNRLPKHCMYCAVQKNSVPAAAGAVATSHTVFLLMLRMAHRIWKETKQEPGTVGPGNMLGCSLVSFHFLWTILSTSTVQSSVKHTCQVP